MPSAFASIQPFRIAVDPEFSIVMPSLNGADTLSTCIRKANAALDEAAIHREIIVAVNGSTDGSVEIAREGACVVPMMMTTPGYGAALMGGIAAAKAGS